MSRQINFYILPADLKAIEMFFNQNGVVFVPSRVYDENNIFTTSLVEPYFTPATYLHYLALKDDLLKIRLNWIERQKYFVVDDYISPVIEFKTGFFLPDSQCKELSRGRLYFKTDYYSDQQLVHKEAAFVRWGISLLNKFKRQFLVKYESQQANLVSPSVIKWLEQSNGNLVL